MHTLASIDWADASADERIAALRGAPSRQVCAMARALDWSPESYDIICWISAQQGIDLGSALTMFLNADPSRLNDVPRDDVAEQDRKICSLLDALCQRINAGYYLPDPTRPVSRPDALFAFLESQGSGSRTSGRWQISNRVLAPLLTDAQIINRRRYEARVRRRGGLIGRLLGPIFS